MSVALAQSGRGLRSRMGQGNKSGRKRADHPDKVAALAKATALIESGMSVTDAAAQSGIARATVYKYMSETKTDEPNKRTGKRTVFANGHDHSEGVRQ